MQATYLYFYYTSKSSIEVNALFQLLEPSVVETVVYKCFLKSAVIEIWPQFARNINKIVDKL
jgi:hypothetical protein